MSAPVWSSRVFGNDGDQTGQRPGGSSHLRVVPYADKLVGDARKPLIILQAAVALVLLIVCVNTANLLLVRGWARQREIAIRTAIGAGRARVLRQFFVESLLLGAIGCAAGLLVARGLTAMMLRLLPLAVPRLSETTIDARVLVFALGACVATTFVFALVPAIAVWKTNVYETLKDGARSASSSHAERSRKECARRDRSRAHGRVACCRRTDGEELLAHDRVPARLCAGSRADDAGAVFRTALSRSAESARVH